MMTLTKGPWIVWQLAPDSVAYGDDAGKRIITTANGEEEVCGIVPSEHDAALIAAAPDLYKAALRMAPVLDWLERLGPDTVGAQVASQLRPIVESAIAKAEGR